MVGDRKVRERERDGQRLRGRGEEVEGGREGESEGVRE